MSKDSKSHKLIIIGGIILCVVLIGVIVFLSLNTEEVPADTDVDVTTTFPANPVLEDINIIDSEEDENQDPLSIVNQNNSMETDFSDTIVTSDFIQDDIVEDTSSSDEDLAFLANYKETHSDEDYSATQTGVTSGNEDPLQGKMDEFLNNPTIGMSGDMIAILGEGFVFPQSGEDVFNNALNGVASGENVDQWLKDEQEKDYDEIGLYEIDSSVYDSCGTISIDVDIDTSEQGIISELSDDTSAMCIADNILNDCEASTVTYGEYTYLLDMVDSVCSVGKMTSGFVNICAIDVDLDDYSLNSSDREKATIVYNIFANPNVTDCSVYKY